MKELIKFNIDSSLLQIKENLIGIPKHKLVWELYPVGFFRLNLSFENRLNEGLYLHFWNKHSLDNCVIDNIHNHIFDLESRVLIGELEDTTYSVKLNESGSYRKSKVIYDDCSSTRRLFGNNYSLTKFKTRIILPNEKYYIKKSIFHSSKVISCPCITIIKKSNLNIVADPIALINTNTKTDLEFLHSITFSNNKIWRDFFEVLDNGCL